MQINREFMTESNIKNSTVPVEFYCPKTHLFGQICSIWIVLGMYVETPVTQIGIFFRLTSVYLFTLNTSVGIGHIYGRWYGLFARYLVSSRALAISSNSIDVFSDRCQGLMSSLYLYGWEERSICCHSIYFLLVVSFSFGCQKSKKFKALHTDNSVKMTTFF